MKHVMVDLETLGTVADAVILSLGAVRFDPQTEEIDDAGFYRSISIESNLDYRRRIQEDTLIWWLKQNATAQAVFHKPKETLETALCDFSDWLGDDSSFMWSNGADFDLPMLALAYTQTTVEIPWKFYNSRCYRTFVNSPAALATGIKKPTARHNALLDAIDQAKTMQAINAALRARDTKVKA